MERFTNIGATLHPSASPAEFATYLAAERETYKSLSAKTGLKVDQ